MRVMAVCIILLMVLGAGVAATPRVEVGTVVRLESVTSTWVPARHVDVWLPRQYASSQEPFAVLYMHDGQMLFDAEQTWNKQSWEVAQTAQRLQDAGKTRPFIVVAIHNGERNRHSEYFPQQALDYLSAEHISDMYKTERQPGMPLFSEAVYSDNYLAFIVKELKPLIDSRFNTDPSAKATAIAGSSMGGLISWYALTQYPEVFGGMAALSTHWPGTFTLENNPLPDAFRQLLDKTLPTPGTHRLYFDYGDATLDALYPALQKNIDELLVRKGFDETTWETHFFPGEDHSERAWAKRLSLPLTFLFGTATQEHD